MRLSISKIPGSVTDEEWSYVHHYSPEGEERRIKRGELVLVIAIKGLSGLEGVTAGRAVMGRISQKYYDDLKSPILAILKQAVEEGKKEFENEHRDQENVTLEVVAGAFVQRDVGVAVYLAGVGGGEVWVRKDGVMGRVLQLAVGMSGASGIVAEGGMVVLGSSGFYGFAEGILRAALSCDNDIAAAEILAPLVEGKGGAAGIIVRVESQARELIKVGKSEEKNSEKEGAKVLDFKGWMERTTDRLSRIGHLRNPAVYVGNGISSGDLRNRGKGLRLVALLLLLLLGASLIFGRQARIKKQTEEKFGASVKEVAAKYQEAEGLVGLNSSRARQLLVEAKTLGAQVVRGGYVDKGFSEMMGKVEGALRGVSGEYVVEPQVYKDLSLVRDGVVGKRMSFSLGRIMILDESGPRLISVVAGSRATAVSGGGALMGGAKLAANYGDRDFVLSDKGLVESKSGQSKVVVDNDHEWGGIGSVAAYGGNLYLLDKTDNMVWRYPGIEGGFGAKQKWMADGAVVDFSKISDMAIDGQIWIGSETGRINKLVLGMPERFDTTGLEKSINSVYRLDTNEEADNLYVLDRENKRVVVLSKDKAEYKAQYLWEGMGGVEDLAVNEKERELYLLSGSKIWVVGLK